MKSFFSPSSLSALTVLAVLLSSFLLAQAPGIAYAETADQNQNTNSSQKNKKRRTPALRESTYKKLSAIQKDIEEEKLAEAEKKINKLLQSSGLNSYEKAQTYNTQAFLFYSQERYRQAIGSYQNILKQNNIPLALELSSLHSLAQLYSVEENYSQALSMIERWFALTNTPTASAYALRAQLEYQLSKRKAARQHIEKAITLYEAKNKTPEEAWWLLLRALYYDNENYRGMTQVLEKLVKWYPKAQYWTQLASLYGQQGQSDKQLQTLDSAYLKGYLKTEKQLLQLVYLLIDRGTPFRAGQITQKGINNKVIAPTESNWRLLATAWYNAKEMEKAIVAMEKSAALSVKSKPYQQLASLYLNKDRFQEGIRAAEKALKKKEADPIRLYTILGSAHLALHHYDEAIAAFEKALDRSIQSEEDSTKLSQWLEHSKQEKVRYNLVKEYL